MHSNEKLTCTYIDYTNRRFVLFRFLIYLYINTKPHSTINHKICPTISGYLFTCITGSLEMSLEAANLIFLLYNLLGGLYLNVVAFPVSKYLSFFFFASEGVSIYYWQGVQNITCDEGRNVTCLRNGEAVLQDYGYGTSLETVYFNYLVMAAEILVIHFAAYLCLRRFVRRVGFY